MSLQSLKDQSAALEAEHKAARNRAALQLAVDIAAGKEVSPEDVVTICDAAGWSQAKLFEEVDFIEQADKERAKIAAAADCPDVLRKVDADREVLEAKFARQVADHKAKSDSLNAIEQAARHRVRVADQSRAWLVNHARQELKNERVELLTERTGIIARLTTLRRHREEYAAEMNGLRYKLTEAGKGKGSTIGSINAEQAERLNKELTSAQRHHDEIVASIIEVESLMADVDSRLADCKQAMVGV